MPEIDSGRLLEAGTFPNIGKKKTGHFSSSIAGWAFIRAWVFIWIFAVYKFYEQVKYS